MADSGYYKRLFEQYEREMRDYEDDIAKLQKIVTGFYNDFCDVQREINRRLDCLCKDLGQAVRRSQRFAQAAAECSSDRQESVTVDVELSMAVSALESELVELNRKRDRARQMKEGCHRSYLNAKEEERRAAAEEMTKLLKGGMI